MGTSFSLQTTVYANYIGPSVMTDANSEGFPIQSSRLMKTVILQESVILQNSVTFIITENCNIKSKITEYCNIRKQGVKVSHWVLLFYCMYFIRVNL